MDFASDTFSLNDFDVFFELVFFELVFFELDELDELDEPDPNPKFLKNPVEFAFISLKNVGINSFWSTKNFCIFVLSLLAISGFIIPSFVPILFFKSF